MPERKIEIMELHATELGGLTPGAVLGAATTDLERRARNLDHNTPGAYEHYAFLRQHVRRSETVRELLERAIDKRLDGLSSGKKNTRIIYRGESVLRQALEVLCDRQSQQAGVQKQCISETKSGDTGESTATTRQRSPSS